MRSPEEIRYAHDLLSFLIACGVNGPDAAGGYGALRDVLCWVLAHESEFGDYLKIFQSELYKWRQMEAARQAQEKTEQVM